MPMIALIILAGGFFIIKNIQSENEIFDPQKYYENKVDLLSDKTPLKTTKLATIQVPLDQTTDSELRILFGPNGNKVLYVIKKDGKGAVVINDIVGKWYDSIVYPKPLFNPNTDEEIYLASDSGKQFIVVGSKEGKHYDNIQKANSNSLLAVSEDFQKTAYIARNDGKSFIVTGDKEGPHYFDLALPVFNKDGSKLVYVAGHRNKTSSILVNNQEIDSSYLILNPQFGPNGEKLIYFACEPSITRWSVNCSLIIDGKKYRTFNVSDEGILYGIALGYFDPVISRDSKRIAYYTTKGNKTVVIVDGEEGLPYDYTSKLILSPDEKKIVYLAHNDDEKEFVVVINGKEEKKHNGRAQDPLIVPPLFSPDSKKLAYVVTKYSDSFPHYRDYLVVNGEEKGPYDHVSEVLFSPDSSEVVYVAEREVEGGGEPGSSTILYENVPAGQPASYTLKYFLFRNDQHSKGYNWIHSPSFSPDGKSLAYIVREGNKYSVIVNDRKGKEYDNILTKLKFSPDGKYVGYGARLGNELWWVIDEARI